jgi:hypothetical protein
MEKQQRDTVALVDEMQSVSVDFNETAGEREEIPRKPRGEVVGLCHDGFAPPARITWRQPSGVRWIALLRSWKSMPG